MNHYTLFLSIVKEFNLKKSVSGEQIWPRLEMFMKVSGLRQARLADLCGVTRQALSDIKAGRRHFSRKMADKAISDSKGEVWEPWLCKALENAFDPPTLDDIKDFFIADDVDATPAAVTTDRYARLPVLLAPFCGDPVESPAFHGEYVNVAAHIAKLALSSEPGYVLRMQNDDVHGRLRQGDLVLVAQTADWQKEFMVVERGGMFLIARSAAHAKKYYSSPDGKKRQCGWVAADTGACFSDAEPVGSVMGIIWAEL